MRKKGGPTPAVLGRAASSPLLAAVRAGDVDEVRRLLACGANPQHGDGRETPLHAAARRGPLALAEALIAGGALEWQTDVAGRTPLDVARRSRARQRAEIVALLDRSLIQDRSFRAAVDAIHAGDVAALGRLLDDEPRLLRERIRGPEAYRIAARHQYFLDPKLFWFVANNPTRVERMPANVVDVARVMIDRGVDKSDLDYTLELTATSSVAREQGHQLPLMRLLLGAGAEPTRTTIVTTAAYRELDALRAMVDAGQPIDAPIAAALGSDALLRDLVTSADPGDIQTAFGLAAVNGHVQTARIALDAGADANAPLPVHAHSSALHQAAIDDRVELIELLLAHGARTDRRDTIWDATPLGWAMHAGRAAARSVLERAR
ncbi:MAG: Ankyrin repeat-containing protein [Candidatus Eremiobacteraeota bacterium]|nr:Ankyrin repeat-containing protein [Candidatus Eremiobacteraeota bacterium]